uniref:WD_REPEATS_REGION domain-containing protein n=1 Tax=Meloidogyne incognita TaxID=6306 RepID=A0A914LDE8_MELIC
MPFAIRRHRDWLFSVGDDRSLRVWTMDGLQIGEIYGHGARPFSLEIFEREKMVFTGGVDEYLNVWRWTEDDDHKRIDLRLERRIEFGSDSLGTIQSILPILKNDSKILNLLISSRMGALVNLRLPLSEVDDHCSDFEPKHLFQFGLNLTAFVVSKSKKCEDFSMLFALDGLRFIF